MPSTHQPTEQQTPSRRDNVSESDGGAADWLAMSTNTRLELSVPTVERALAKGLPTCKICIHDLNLTARVTVIHAQNSTANLPTLWNTMRNYFEQLNAKRDMADKVILKDIHAIFPPGSMTLILGQPGSGKSSLLKYVSGRFHMSKNVNVQGQVTYNGVPQKEIKHNLSQTVTYVHQRDHHSPMLTVKETLQFARDFCSRKVKDIIETEMSRGSIEENQEARRILERHEKHNVALVLKTLGLENCQNTIVGDGNIRGVSGGERKRVTTGEMQFGCSNAYMMDEISTGLDSAATYDIVRSLQSTARNLRKTVVIGLLQPSPEVFQLFDNMILMNEGRIIYQGPREEAIPYFESLGFYCPPLQDHADFLLDLCTSQQFKYLRNHTSQKAPRTSEEFAEAYRRSSYYQNLLNELQAEASKPVPREEIERLKSIPQFQQTFWENTVTLLQRQAILIQRNNIFLAIRLIMSIFVGLIYGSLFYQLDMTESQLTIGVIFVNVLFMVLGQTSQTSNYMRERALFYKQRDANFYRTGAYIIASYLNVLPGVIMETLVFGSITYWMCGLVNDIWVYLCTLLILFLMTIAMASYFFFVTTVVPDLNIAQPLTLISTAFYILFAGFVVVKSEIPDWLIWIYWLDPFAWTIRSLMVFQYRHSNFDVCVYKGLDYCAQFNKQASIYALDLFGVPTAKGWSYGAIPYLFGVYIFFMILSYFGLEKLRFEENPAPTTILANQSHQTILSHTESNEVHPETPEPVYYSAETPRVSIEGDTVLDIASPTKAFAPITLAFQDLWYSVPDPKNPNAYIDLLKGVSGYALPGTMTALMGSSGAGKTTLMDVIAGRKTGGRIQGKITLNGHEASRLAICRLTGYCEQMDIHCEGATIREALMFSARLRQDKNVSDGEIIASVQESLNLLNLNAIADQIVRGRSVEEMKRLTIGVELAAQTSVLFLDEPTSGLDAHAAKIIMKGVRKVANSGRTIVCTIHQPSYAVFSVFDQLLLLRRGGSTVYFGPLGEDCKDLIQYFERQPGVAKIPSGYNPATWMLECIGAGVGKHGEGCDFAEIFQLSQQKQRLDDGLSQEGIGIPSRQYSNPTFDSKRASSSYMQCRYVIQRFFLLYWRLPTYNLTRIAVAVCQGLIFGLVYLNAERRTYQQVNSTMGMVFMSTLFLGITTFNSAIPVCFVERAAYYRERACQTYNAFWYFLGGSLVEIPYIFFSTLLYTIVFYTMVNFQHFSSAVIFWISSSLYVLLSAYIGQFFAYLCPQLEIASLLGVVLNTISFSLLGYNPPAKFIPQGYKWLYQIIPFRYPFSIVSSTTLARCKEASDIGCRVMEDAPPSVGLITVKQYIEGTFNMWYDKRGKDFGITIAFIVAFQIFALIALRYLNHQKR